MTATRVYDVVVVGGGPAGMAAASAAAESGARVVMVDEGAGPGGQIWRPGVHSLPSRASRRSVARLVASGAKALRSTSVVDAWRVGDTFTVTAESRGVGFEITAKSLVLATGARERFLPFPGWTLPNVFGIGGAQALLKGGVSFRGKRVVIAGSGPLLLPVAASLAHAGAKLVLVAEQAPIGSVARFAAGLLRHPATLAQAVALRVGFMSSPYATGSWVTEARGDTTVRAVTLSNGRTKRTVDCDVLCAAFGLVPNTELARVLGCAVENGAVRVDDAQATTVAGVYCCGEPTGIGGVDLALVEGEIAGHSAVARRAPSSFVARRAARRLDAERLARAFTLRGELLALADRETIVCRCEDVRWGALDRRWSSRQAKLYTRVGMGPCQGRVCGAALECLMGWAPDSVRIPTQPARCHALVDRVASEVFPNEPGVS